MLTDGKATASPDVDEPRQKRPPHLTIGIGLICKDGIVLASDSRTEEPEGSIKRFDLPNITTFVCGDFACGIVQAGKTAFSSRCADEIKRRATENPPKSIQKFRDIVTSVAKEIRRHAIDISPSLDAESRALHARFSLIIAICGQTYDLFTLESWSCYDQPETKSGRAFIGTGAILASYILEGLDFHGARMSSGAVAGIYAIRGVNLKDPDCEGPIRVWRIYAPPKQPNEFDRDMVEDLENDCARFEAGTRKEWLEGMAAWMLGQGETIRLKSKGRDQSR